VNDSPVGCQSRSATKPAGANRALLGEPKTQRSAERSSVLLSLRKFTPATHVNSRRLLTGDRVTRRPVGGGSARAQRRNRENRARATASGVSRPYFKQDGLQGEGVCVSSMRAAAFFAPCFPSFSSGTAEYRKQRSPFPDGGKRLPFLFPCLLFHPASQNRAD